MFSTDFIFRQQENLVDNQKSQAGYRPLRNKILFPHKFVNLFQKSIFVKIICHGNMFFPKCLLLAKTF